MGTDGQGGGVANGGALGKLKVKSQKSKVVRRLLLRLIGLTAAIVAAVLVWALATLPPAALHPSSGSGSARHVPGAYHVHTSRSDGSGSVDDVAAAAARAGLRFVILTDHGDATRTPEPPAYRHGVLCIDAVEISSADGHIVAINLAGAAPYPLAGETRDVLEDIHRMGGWGIAAHPDSPKPELRWRDRGARDSANIDGIEWFNADSASRAHSPGTLAAAAAHAIFRAPESIAGLFETPVQSLARWDNAQSRSAPFGIAALDAHARLGGDASGGVLGRLSLAFPGYETMFRTVTQTVVLDQPLINDATTDSAAILAAIGAGRSYSVVRAFLDAPDALEEFSATRLGSGPGTVVEAARAEFGGSIEPTASVALHAALRPGVSARLSIIGNGREVASGMGTVDLSPAPPGAYRVEARLSGRGMPWIVSNAIRVAAVRPTQPTPGVPGGGAAEAGVPIPAGSWVIEKDAFSTGAVEPIENAVRVRYRLGAGTPAGQFVAAASSASGNTPVEQVAFTASSARPMRISVQVRVGNGQRWARSIYIDRTPRTFRLPLSDFRAVDRGSLMQPIAARVQSVLIVIDTLNTNPGADGEVLLQSVAYVAGRDTADAPGALPPAGPGRRGR